MAAKKLKRKPVSKLLPITRTIRLLRASGWIAGRVEEARGKISFDWAGYADVIAWRPPNQWFLVQCTGTTSTTGNVWERVRKIRANAAARAMIFAGERVEVWGWSRYKIEHMVVQMMPCDLGCPMVALGKL
jgi:hypothetical protein|tara:strand:+ start:7550 stop:7942 length:393 start_codon:yes stop_codon:yes gene_type:complete